LKLRVVLGTLLLAGAAYFAVFGGEYSMLELHQLRAERDMEVARLDSAGLELARLQARADSLSRDSATIERLARERHGLIRPGERLFRFADSAAADRPARPPAAGN
jgi:cell division protein FtsB